MTVLVTGRRPATSAATWSLRSPTRGARGGAGRSVDRIAVGGPRRRRPSSRAASGDETLVRKVVAENAVTAIVHFAGSIVVPDSVTDPLSYYLNNTVRSRALIAAAVAGGVKAFVFSSTAAVYGEASAEPLSETSPLDPVSPYGASKLMTERMLADSAAAYDFRYAALRYFNVAGRIRRGAPGSRARAPRI